MALDIASIREDRAPGTAEYMGSTVNFTYRPAMVTAEHFRILAESRDVNELSEYLSTVIASWDLTQGGHPLDITPVNVAKLPLMLMRGMTKFISTEIPQKDLGNV